MGFAVEVMVGIAVGLLVVLIVLKTGAEMLGIDLKRFANKVGQASGKDAQAG
jgi:hypothetical protein